ncbi:hypothetical protein [Halorarum salinum]|nr:hypothetical protein [Halobaculum salinum]
MTSNEANTALDQFDRPFEPATAPGLSHELAENKAAQLDDAMDQRMQYWEEDQPYATTDFTTPLYLDEEDWW